MNKIVSFLFGWIDLFIHIYIHITATINAVIFVANKSKGITAEELILERRRTKAKRPARQANQYTQLRRQAVKEHTSPFKQIPNEILIIIFESLDQSDLYHCSTVTKHWNELLTPILWRSLQPNYRILRCIPSLALNISKKVTHRQMSHFPLHLSRYGHAVKSLDLQRLAFDVTDNTIRHIVRFCPHLTSLNLSDSQLITDEGLRCLAGYSSIKVLILQNCRKITDIGLSYLKSACHQLETLHLGGCNLISDNGIIGLVTASGNTIRRINLSDCSHVTGSTIHAIAGVCGPRLEWLDIKCTKAIRHTDLEYLVTHCPNISRLNVSMKKKSSLRELRHRLSQNNRRTHNRAHLQEDSNVEVSDINEDMENYLQRTSTMDESNPLNELIDLVHRLNVPLALTDTSAQHYRSLMEKQKVTEFVSNHTVELIALNLKKLEHLNLSYWPCVDDKTVLMLSIHTRCLTYLNLIGCRTVTKKALRYLSRKSTCNTLSDVMLSSHSYENDDSSWTSNSSSSASCSSSSDEKSPKLSPVTMSKRSQIATQF
ncbi:uncharacterized protein EV154DRAFT_510266 [Mucor mucedo]|uniref:uncharacterized protein n=1 Tax=Mucor mucedo TaxID=29922 RepID=UPI00221F48A1|nr:uncharacterized protein EV154DRAFT_510266 [Mucor mucedo]KAI7890812.1 hypothetical protein EV154DRAFT_510266 [Mucor mucedo]